MINTLMRIYFNVVVVNPLHIYNGTEVLQAWKAAQSLINPCLGQVYDKLSCTHGTGPFVQNCLS